MSYTKSSCYVVSILRFLIFFILKGWSFENVYHYYPFVALYQICWNFNGPSLFQIVRDSYPANYMAFATVVPILFLENDFWQIWINMSLCLKHDIQLETWSCIGSHFFLFYQLCK